MLHAVHATVTGGTPQTGQMSQNADLQLWLAARGLTPQRHRIQEGTGQSVSDVTTTAAPLRADRLRVRCD